LIHQYTFQYEVLVNNGNYTHSAKSKPRSATIIIAVDPGEQAEWMFLCILHKEENPGIFQDATAMEQDLP
jgi:hypothetical protein